MRPAAFPERALDVVFGKKFRERIGCRKCAVLRATAYPQQANLPVGGLRLADEAHIRLREICCVPQARAETGDVTEKIEIVQPDAQRLAAAH